MKRQILFLTVDLGTSFIKTGIYDTEGNCIAEAKEPVEDERPCPGVVIQRGEKLFASVLRCMKMAVQMVGSEAGKIEAISFTGQMAGFMGVDKDWNDITTWSCFIDGRFVPYAQKQMEQLADQFLNISGTNSPLMAPKIQWFQTEYPQEAKKIAKYMMISSYVIGRLGDMDIEDAVIDHSFISWTGLADISSQTWSKELCRLTGTEERYLPRIVRSDQICGRLSAAMAGEVGLNSGIPLVAGAGDKVSGCVGAGVLESGDAIFEAGSYGAVSCMVEECRMNPEANYYDLIPAAVSDYYVHKYIPGSGITLDWFINTFAQRQNKKTAFADMEKKAALVPPGCEGLMAIGLLGGNAMPFDGDIKGMWLGHTWSHKAEHFYRALLESFAFDLALTVDSVQEKYPEYAWDALKVIGGGARSGIWLQILADVTGKKFLRLNRNDVALWGSALLAGSGLGIFDDLKGKAKEKISVIEEVVPDPSKKAFYDKRKKLYRDAVTDLRGLYKALQK